MKQIILSLPASLVLAIGGAGESVVQSEQTIIGCCISDAGKWCCSFLGGAECKCTVVANKPSNFANSPTSSYHGETIVDALREMTDVIPIE